MGEDDMGLLLLLLEMESLFFTLVHEKNMKKKKSSNDLQAGITPKVLFQISA